MRTHKPVGCKLPTQVKIMMRETGATSYWYQAPGSGHLESQGRQLRLVPGMQVNAEIHLGTRTVLEYLLSSVQKIAHEAGRER